MRGLVIFVLICATFADDPVHYPTNHPGVCNILAFVSEHVDEVVHVAHDEVEGHLHHNNSHHQSRTLSEDMKKVKRQVEEIMELNQCLVTELENTTPPKEEEEEQITEEEEEKEAITEIPITTTEIPQEDDELKEIQRSARDVNYLVENYNSFEKHFENDEEQHVATRHIRDVSHLLHTIPLQSSALENEVKVENNLRHLKTDYPETGDILTQETEHVARVYGEQLFPPTIGQHVDFQGREKRNVANTIKENLKTQTKRLVRDVKSLLKPQSSLRNSVTDLIRNSQDLRSSPRIVRSSLKNIEKPKEIPTHPKLLENNLQHISSSDVNNIRPVRSFEDITPSEVSTQKPLDLEPKEEKAVKPVRVKTHHTKLPLTQFAKRKSNS